MSARTGSADDILKRHPASSNVDSPLQDVFALGVEKILETPAILLIMLILILAQSLYILGVVPFSASRVLCNLLVYLIPSRIFLALDSKTNDSGDSDPSCYSITVQEKLAAMQRLIGFNHCDSFLSLFPRGRSFPGLGNSPLGPKDNLPPGLGNWDNSCYQNSVVQGLASLQSFSRFLDHNVESLAERGALPTHLALKGIIERLNSGSSHGQKLWIPPNLKSMSSWQQQDAQEYFSKIVDQMDREIRQALRGQTKNLGLKMVGPQEQIGGDTSPSIDEGSCPTSRPVLDIHTLRNPLEGLLAQKVGCMKCEWSEGLSLIPFNCLTVPLGGRWEYDVRDCLDQYMGLEPIEGVECTQCTLLRARDQLRQLLQQIEEDREAVNAPEAPQFDNILKKSAESRLKAIEDAIDDEDFTEKTLTQKCHIPTKNRVTTIKARQAVIARAPTCLIIHINRSVFDENTGMLRKNHADVRFPNTLDLSEWCLGTKLAKREGELMEQWYTNPQSSMLPDPGEARHSYPRRYELRAVITHYGRHENGHYVCYRKYPMDKFPAHVPEVILEADGEKEKSDRWYRLSDEDVQMVSERSVMSQGGVFMLFYETVEDSACQSYLEMASVSEPTLNLDHVENMSTSAATDGLTQDGSESSWSRSTSISPPDRVVPSIDDFDTSLSMQKVESAALPSIQDAANEAVTQSMMEMA